MASYTTLRNGSKGSDVIKLQNALINAGYDVGSLGADGIYGAKTQAAVKAYQKANGLTVDGIAGKNTLGSLYSTKSTNTNQDATNTIAKINGVDQSTIDKAYNSTFTESKDATNQKDKADELLGAYENIASQKDIIDQSTLDALNKKFEVSDAYNKAMEYTNGLLEQLSSGKTSWTDRYNEAMNKYLNREEFEYDVDSDPLFQQALASAMSSGKSAMQDTIGQASALTGGYGSTYATSVGNQAYNSFIEDAYNNLPEYYQMALQSYQAEGEEMLNQVAMLGEADANEYQRTYNSWAANFENAQQIWNQDFSTWEAGVNQAYNSANLQLSEHGQLVENAYNLYAANKDAYESMYAKEYQTWADSVAQAQQYASMLNTDWWNQTNFDESVRQYEKTFAENQRQFNETMAYNKSKDTGSGSKSGYVTRKDKNGNEVTYKEPTETQMKKALEAYNSGGEKALNQYVDSLPSNIDIESIDTYVNNYGELPLEMRTYTKTKDTTNWLWGIDNNDEVTDEYENVFRIDELPESIRKDLTKLGKGKSYTAK